MPAKPTRPPEPPPASPDRRAAPVRTFRLGRIKAAVWENETDKRKLYNVTFSRTYMDEQEKFHDSDSFGRDDLLLLAKLADQAHTFIFEQLAKQKDTQPD